MNIGFRYKNRFSIILIDNKKCKIRVDLTSVKNNSFVNLLEKTVPQYELEVDYMIFEKLTPSMIQKNKKVILDMVLLLNKVLINNNNLLKISEKHDILKRYKKIIHGDENYVTKKSYTMNSQSLEVIHLVDYLPNKYCITDKADGDRYLGIFLDYKLYYITTNLGIKYSGITIDKKLSKYNNSIVDGEYIFIKDQNKYMYLIFDILFLGDKDVRNEKCLNKRLEYVDELLENCFNIKNDYIFDNKEIDMKKINKNLIKNMTKYSDFLNKLISRKDNNDVIFKKYFIFLKGICNCEIFSYSYNMWETYTKKIKLPYLLDGLIYTPQNQIYTKSAKDIKFKTYKWKPENNNSIDFYVKIERSKDTGNILNVYDDSYDENITGKTYQILNLHVGKMVNGVEIPIPFQKNSKMSKAYIFSKDGIIKDIEGNIIQDNTVVEFYYDLNSNLDIPFRWIPLRTRYDKTESIMRYNRLYGNNNIVAIKIWNSIQQNINMNDIKLLSDMDNYNNEIEKIKTRITASYIAMEKQMDVYYQKITNLAKPMRNFHNYIKSNMIFQYCSKKYYNGKMYKMSILDIGCGRGGDIQKFYHVKPKLYVGFDPDSNGIYGSATDGAVSRYNNFRKKFPNFPKMQFIVANASTLLNLDNQKKIIGNTKTSNEKLIENIFGKNNNSYSKTKFDVFNCQLSLHLIINNKLSMDNYCSNIKQFLNNDGYILITTLDGDLLHRDFKKNNGKITSEYIDDNQNNTLFCEFIAKYDYTNDDLNKYELSYDFYNILYKDEGKYDREFLLSKDFIINTFKKNNIELVETDLFINIYNLQKNFFTNVADNEDNVSSKSYFKKVAEYYNLNDEVNKASLNLTKYHRYYIFQNKNKNISGGKKKQTKNVFEI